MRVAGRRRGICLKENMDKEAMQKEAMQRRYNELGLKDDASEEGLPDEERKEYVGLFYLLNPEHQYWRNVSPDLRPEDLYPQVKKWVQP